MRNKLLDVEIVGGKYCARPAALHIRVSVRPRSAPPCRYTCEYGLENKSVVQKTLHRRRDINFK